SRHVSGPEGGANPAMSELSEAATLHGRELWLNGFSVDQVVHDYGDLCQAITALAYERNVAIDIDEFRTLNRCLDNAMADAVTEFCYERDVTSAKAESEMHQRRGVFVHELRDNLHAAQLAFQAIKSGGVAVNGATGAALERSHARLASLIERSILDVRATAALPPRNELVSLADFVSDAVAIASLEAKARECIFITSNVDASLAIDVDRDLLLSALSNLLTNAFKYTCHRTEVRLSAYAAADRVLIEVADNCGGISESSIERLFLPFTQGNGDRSGRGRGLCISRRSVEANGGTLRVRDVPGTGCVFTIDLPRHLVPGAEPAIPASSDS
ncbi:MAG TPA: HAMP domain-containing sensor histidine kinase, partial [Usitatibacter sp.]|nr:HAMP domain-containing sensor histidine kinase [Usitatibacter sp.]